MATGSSIIKKTLIGLVVILVVIQFIRPEKNNNATASADDINALYTVPDSVQQILKRACYDCHSNTTQYPWYSNIQPVAWWLNDHIHEGKDELNFSEFGKRPLAKQVKKLKKLAEEVEEGEMPLNSYTWIHKEAVLTESEKHTLINWANRLSEQVAVNTPQEKEKG